MRLRSDPFTQEDFPLCAPQSMRVVGSIDDMSIDVTLPGAGGGLAQDNAGGEFQYQGNYRRILPRLTCA